MLSPTTNMHNDMTPELNAALVAAIAETTDVHADATNPFHKSKYATLGAHLAAIKPIFAKHGLAILQFPIGFGGAVGIRTVIVHKSGQSMGADFFIDAPEITKDGVTKKGYTAQEAGAVLSYSRRYSLASVAGTATEDDDAETDRVAHAKPSMAIKSVAKTNYIPNPAHTGVGPDTKFVVPFGDCKGQPLASLPKRSGDRTKKCSDLYYWAKNWTPKPFGDNPEPSPKDLALKAEAERLFNLPDAPAEVEASVEQADDVPF